MLLLTQAPSLLCLVHCRGRSLTGIALSTRPSPSLPPEGLLSYWWYGETKDILAFD